jgi:hypothetical protein
MSQPIPPRPPRAKKEIPEVLTVRNAKEYIGESLLIIFSVLLALLLTEFITDQHEKSDAKELVHNIRQELINNKTKEQAQFDYDRQVLAHIDSALSNADLLRPIVADGEFHLNRIAPMGIQYRYLDHAAWDIAKSRNILAHMDTKTLSRLTWIYEEQERIMKLEGEVAKVVLSREAGRTEQARETLILIRNNFKAWAVDRAPGLLQGYKETISLLSD